MSLLDLIGSKDAWESFYAYKTGLACPKAFAKELRGFIDEGGYLSVASSIRNGEPFPLAKRSVISKMASEKKRVVYTYPEPENTVLKLLTYEMLRKYDRIYPDNLFSFRPGRSAKDGIRKILRIKNLDQKYVYKVDIHDYFNSVPVQKLIPMMRAVFSDDAALSDFLESLLFEPNVIERGGIIREEQKGIMAGTPISSFFANLYLIDMDLHFEALSVPYVRYSDDVIVLADSKEELDAHVAYIHETLKERGLTVNPKKEWYGLPGEPFTFLGFSYEAGVVDIAEATVKKLKQKMRRKARSLMRWQKRSEAGNESAAKAFIRIFNRKLLEGPKDNELTWSYWFFPIINTTRSLHAIDLYAQDCIRFLLSGTHRKSRYDHRYTELRALGYRNLVHAYYENTKNSE